MYHIFDFVSSKIDKISKIFDKKSKICYTLNERGGKNVL
uniref:Uncharacterized protein n=1 Tax=Podoviridae sp. ctQZJ2 TaxID=2825248 RepID=A0A8S5P6Y8_9CAUD|nr:MAG TPA: hypothetical protein [Podoviridae sp. ctQZJ2]